MKRTKTNHFKDRSQLKKQCKYFFDTMERERYYLSILAEKCQESLKDGCLSKPVLKEKLIAPISEGKEQKPNHSLCKGFKNSPKIGGEKQICHCMFYRNNDIEKRCENCSLIPWENDGNIIVEQFEYPTKYEMKGIGGIDLILKDGNKRFGAEVKPLGSNETLSRMIAEILTYYSVDNLIEYDPAIAVFEGSKQKKVIDALEEEKNDVWQEIKKYVTVFVIEYKEITGIKKFKIKPYAVYN